MIMQCFSIKRNSRSKLFDLSYPIIYLGIDEHAIIATQRKYEFYLERNWN